MLTRDLTSYREQSKEEFTVLLRETVNGKSKAIKFPKQFVESRNRKYVAVKSVRFMEKNEPQGTYSIINTVSIHASFNQNAEEPFDQFIWVNRPNIFEKVYEQYNTVDSFKVWFREWLKSDAPVMNLDPAKTVCLMELELRY